MGAKDSSLAAISTLSSSWRCGCGEGERERSFRAFDSLGWYDLHGLSAKGGEVGGSEHLEMYEETPRWLQLLQGFQVRCDQYLGEL